MKEEPFERVHAGGMGSFSTTAVLSVTGHVLVLFLVFMVSSLPVSVRKSLDRLPIIHATLVSEKGTPSFPPHSAVAVKRKAEEQNVVVKSRAIPKASEQKTILAPLSTPSPPVVEKAGGSSSAMSIGAKSVGASSSAGGAGTSLAFRSAGDRASGAGGTSAVPRYRSNPHPPYPNQARIRGHEGLVVLTAEVREDGRVSGIRLKRSSGYSSLDQSALTTVRSWLFEPARRFGTAVASVVDIPVRFSLHDESEYD
jgi:TonB family protein